MGNLTNNNSSQINDGWELSPNKLLLPKMENDINNKKLGKTESVVIAKNGEIIYENYFSGFNAVTPHDMRSASKSISSAIVGVSIDNKLIKSTDQSIYEFLPEEYQYHMFTISCFQKGYSE